MGKTYRSEKSDRPRGKRLNNHRELPDYHTPKRDYDDSYGVFDESNDDSFDLEIEKYYAKKIPVKE